LHYIFIFRNANAPLTDQPGKEEFNYIQIKDLAALAAFAAHGG